MRHEGTDETRAALGGATVAGYLRRARRILDCSQRALAQVLGVDKSTVARWESGATAMSVADLASVLSLAGLALAVVDRDGEVVDPMSEDAVRDRAGRRYPAHADLRSAGWWTPRDSRLTPREWTEERRSAERGDPRILYGLGWLRDLERSFYGVPADHPSRVEVVARVRLEDARRRSQRSAS